MDTIIKGRRRGQELRRNLTKEERHLWYDFLKTYPVQFRRQYQVGPYYLDFYCYQVNIAVELDGSQHFEPEAIQYDLKRTRFLAERGITVLRFSNLDIWKNFEAVCQVIDEKVKEALQG